MWGGGHGRALRTRVSRTASPSSHITIRASPQFAQYTIRRPASRANADPGPTTRHLRHIHKSRAARMRERIYACACARGGGRPGRHVASGRARDVCQQERRPTRAHAHLFSPNASARGRMCPSHPRPAHARRTTRAHANQTAAITRGGATQIRLCIRECQRVCLRTLGTSQSCRSARPCPHTRPGRA